MGFLNPADSSPVRVCAWVDASPSGPTKTRKMPSLGAGDNTTWKPFLPSASAIISASGRDVATTCQYWPPDGSPEAVARTGGAPGAGAGAGDGGGLGLFSWGGTGSCLG